MDQKGKFEINDRSVDFDIKVVFFKLPDSMCMHLLPYILIVKLGLKEQELLVSAVTHMIKFQPLMLTEKILQLQMNIHRLDIT